MIIEEERKIYINIYINIINMNSSIMNRIKIMFQDHQRSILYIYIYLISFSLTGSKRKINFKFYKKQRRKI